MTILVLITNHFHVNDKLLFYGIQFPINEDDNRIFLYPFLEVFRFPFIIRGKHLVDWGKKNYIVMAVDDSVGVFDADVPSTLTCERYDNDGFVTSVKWSNDGISQIINNCSN